MLSHSQAHIRLPFLEVQKMRGREVPTEPQRPATSQQLRVACRRICSQDIALRLRLVEPVGQASCSCESLPLCKPVSLPVMRNHCACYYPKSTPSMLLQLAFDTSAVDIT